MQVEYYHEQSSMSNQQKKKRNRSMFRIVVCIAITVIAAMCWLAPAQAATPTLTYLGTEVQGDNQPVNTYHVDCDGEKYIITIEVRFVGGGVQLLTSDRYCDNKFYVSGSIELAKIVKAIASEPDTVSFVYLPVVGR